MAIFQKLLAGSSVTDKVTMAPSRSTSYMRFKGPPFQMYVVYTPSRFHLDDIFLLGG
jgi:hypothetical protein